jgi:hypothetical protein
MQLVYSAEVQVDLGLRRGSIPEENVATKNPRKMNLII